MAIEFKLPEVSEGVESADVAELHVAEGDTIEAGQIVMEVETEKAVVEVPCPHAGKVSKLHVKPGETIKVGATILTIEGGNGAPKAAAPAQKDAVGKPAATQARVEAQRDVEPHQTREEIAAKVQPAKAAPARTADDDSNREQKKGGDDSERVLVQTGPERAQVTQEAREAAEPDDGKGAPPPAGPATRRMARQLGVDLRRVEGSGPGGRITSDDVQSFVRTSLTTSRPHDVTSPMAPPALPDFTKFGPVERHAMSKLARTSAANLSLSWQTVPHVTQHDLADVTDLESARQSYMSKVGKNGPKITMTAIMVKAVIAALRAYPNFNSSLDPAGGELLLKRYYNIGVAVDTEFGLVVPVIRDADRKSVLEIAAELTDIAQRARDRKLDMKDMQGGTFTITNLGGIGGTSFTPIVNYPEVAILGMSRTQKRLELVDGKPAERLLLPLSLSYDHRVVNGADAARFIVKLTRVLSDFFQMVIEG